MTELGLGEALERWWILKRRQDVNALSSEEMAELYEIVDTLDTIYFENEPAPLEGAPEPFGMDDATAYAVEQRYEELARRAEAPAKVPAY